jgi:2,4-dienoyl-CoA reductase (NADPH2)
VHGGHRGGLMPPNIAPSPRDVYLLQRKKEKMGQRLGKTTGWIHRLSLKHKKVHMLNGVSYDSIDNAGLHIRINDKPQLLPVDTIVICAGQTELNTLYTPLKEAGKSVHLIGGAYKAMELDARHAIDQACRLAALI